MPLYSNTVTETCRSLAATLKITGPSLIASPTILKPLTETLLHLLRRSHPCQSDFGLEIEDNDLEESAEYDWLVVDCTLDAIIGLATALGASFTELFKIFEKSILKLASSSEHIERSTAVGTIAECIRGMGPAITPSTSTLLKLLLHRLSDEDAETKSNAAFAIGLLQEKSQSDPEILKAFPAILGKLEPMLQTERARMMDNAAGCVSRMIMRHQDHMPIKMVLPALVELLPLKEDYEENEPVWGMIVRLCKLSLPLPPLVIPSFLCPNNPLSSRLRLRTHHPVPNPPTPPHPQPSPQPPQRAAQRRHPLAARGDGEVRPWEIPVRGEEV